MPIYEYRCSKCGFQDEYLQKVSEPPLKVCPSCGKAKFEKLLSAPGFQLKGSGWYATDFKGGSKPGPAQADPRRQRWPKPKQPETKSSEVEIEVRHEVRAKSGAAKPRRRRPHTN